MNGDQFKDPLSCLCLADSAETSLSLTQEVAGSNSLFKKTFVTEFSEVNENILRKLK